MFALAFSDVHSPKYLNLLKASGNFSLVLMAGDLVDRSEVKNLKPVVEFAKSFSDVIVAVFGNEEYREREEEFRKAYPEVIWLNDEYKTFSFGKGCLAIVGSRGSLLKPTSWQRKFLPEVEEEYKRKPEVVRELIREAKKECPNVIYMSHYAPTWRTLVGEERRIWPYLGDPRVETVLKEEGVKLAIHGHAHKGRVAFVHIGSLTIYNVALPARGKPTSVRIALQSRLIR